MKAEAGWGRATYDISLRRLARHYRAVADDPDRSDEQRAASLQKAGRTERLLAWIAAILASVPAGAADQQVAIHDIVDAALGFLAACAAKASALDGAAAIALQDAVADLRALGSFRCPLPVALRFVRERVEGVSVGRDRSRPGHLHVSRLAQAGLPNRPLLFIVGLEEGRVFPAAVEDPVLLDAERQRISPALRCSSDRTDEAVHAVLARLAVVDTAAGGEVCLSYSCRDLREYRGTFPSWLMLQAYRLQTADPSKSYPDLKAALGAPKSCVPESAAAALGDAGWWLHGLKLAGAAAKPSVLRQFPALAQGIRAEEAREAPAFGEYDGFVPAAGKVLDPCARERPASSTQLQSGRGVSLPPFPRVWAGPPGGGRRRAGQRRVARPHGARHGAARSVRGDAGEVPRRETQAESRNRIGRGCAIGHTTASRSCATRCLRRRTTCSNARRRISSPTSSCS